VADNEVVLQGWLGDDEASAATIRRVLVVLGEVHEVAVCCLATHLNWTVTLMDSKLP